MPNFSPQGVYPGDDAFEAFLDRYLCPLSLQAMKFRIWGQITTVAMTVSPVQEIKSMWDDELPTFVDEAEASSFFEMIMSLWNTLAEMNMTGKRFNLSQRSGLGDLDGLRRMVERRLDELDEGFLNGFSADMRPFDENDPKLTMAIGRLVELIDGLDEVAEDLEEADPAYDLLRAEFVRLDGKAQQRLDAVVKAANVARGVNVKTADTH